MHFTLPFTFPIMHYPTQDPEAKRNRILELIAYLQAW